MEYDLIEPKLYASTIQLHPRLSLHSRVVRAFAIECVDSGLIPSQNKPMTLKLASTASLLDAQH